jgi:16S rRNA (guanine527-N7)-methyltransferase
MRAERIAELLEPFLGEGGREQFEAGDLEHISMYMDILLRWNARVNLTAIRDPEQIVTRHFGESLFLARHLFPRIHHERQHRDDLPPSRPGQTGRGAGRLADLGSGAGFPGIPIKMWAPNMSVTLIEANHKKATFLREVVRHLELPDIQVENTRGETLVPATFDVVTLRAVERFSEALVVAHRLVRPNGRVALMISSQQVAAALSSPANFDWPTPERVPRSNSRLVLVGKREP